MFHMLCFSHGLHLAVTDVLYVSKETTQDDENSDDESTEENEAPEDEGQFLIEDEDTADIEENYGEITKKVRKIVRFFRKSPLKNDLLQKIIRDDLEMELCLVADVKTRWGRVWRRAM